MPGPGDKKSENQVEEFEDIDSEEQMDADETLLDGTEEVDDEDIQELDFEQEDERPEEDWSEEEAPLEDYDEDSLGQDDEISMNDLSMDPSYADGVED